MTSVISVIPAPDIIVVSDNTKIGPQGPVGNLVFVSQNGSPALTSNLLNFVNTATITVDVVQNGMNSEIAFTAVGGAAFDQANLAFDQANVAYGQANLAYDAANNANINAISAYDQANTATDNAQSAYNQANVAYSQANLAYDQANTAYGQANLAYSQANLAYDQANTATLNADGAYNQANNAYSQANAAYDQANTATLNADGAYNQANAAFNQANTAYNEALAIGIITGDAYNQANAAFDQANIVYAQANTAYDRANVAYGQANSAYDQANAAFNAANNAQVTVYANSASNITTQKLNFVNTSTITVTVTPSGTNANISFTAVGGAAYDQANAAYNQANLAYAQANSAYNEANLKLNLTGGSITGDLTISGNLYVNGTETIVNTESLTINDPIFLLANNNVTNAVALGFTAHYGPTQQHTGLIRAHQDNNWYLFEDYDEHILYANNVLDTSNIKLATLRANINANSLLLIGNTVATQANLTLAYDQANAASIQANAARDQANAAFDAANNNQVTVVANNGLAIDGSDVLSTIYDTTISDGVTSVAVGGATAQDASEWRTKNIVQVLDAILFPDIAPTYTIPTITITSSITGTREIGETITPLLTANGVKNDANTYTQIAFRRGTTTINTNTALSVANIANVADQFGYSNPNNPNQRFLGTYTDSFVITSGSTTWLARGSYNAGIAKRNNKGVVDTRTPAVRTTTAPQAACTTFDSATTSVTGIYPYFWGVSATQPTASSIAADIAAGNANKVLAVATGTVTVTFNASSEYVWLAHIGSATSKTKWFNTALNNGDIGAGQFILAPVLQNVNSPDGFWSAQSFKVYISGFATTTSGSIEFRNT